MIRAIAFDLDDTLYPEMQYIMQGYKAVASYLAKTYDLKQGIIYKELLQMLQTDRRKQAFNELIKRYKITEPKLVEQLVAVYRGQDLKLNLFPKAKEVLQTLKQQYVLALITDGPPDVQQAKIDQLRIGSYFDSIIYTEALGATYAKPNPAVLQAFMEDTKLENRQAVYVGNDPEKDIVGPKKAGMITIRVLQGRMAHNEYPAKLAPDYTIKAIAQLPILMRRIDTKGT